jgi:hypothetical protein
MRVRTEAAQASASCVPGSVLGESPTGTGLRRTRRAGVATTCWIGERVAAGAGANAGLDSVLTWPLSLMTCQGDAGTVAADAWSLLVNKAPGLA